MAALSIGSGTARTQTQRLLLTGLEAVVPLAVGMTVVTVIAEDSCRELAPDLPTEYTATLGRRLALVAGVAVAGSLGFSGVLALTGWWSGPSFAASPLVWAPPLLALTGLAMLVAVLGRSVVLATTTVAGVMPATSGRVIAGGHDLGTRDGRLAVQRRLGYLPQDLGLYPDLTPVQFLDYIGLLKGLDDKPARLRQIGELLDMVGLSEVSGRKLKGFSGGMRRRVGIAQALLGDPALIVVDEPTAGLDPEERIRFRTLLATLAGHRTVLLSTHVVEDVAQTCRETAVMAAGEVVFAGPVADLVRHAEGATWEVTSAGPPPTTGVVVSAVSRADGTHYRVISPTPPDPAAVPVTPSLEDGYVALMQRR